MELRKDQPIYLYEEGVSIAGRCAYRLKKMDIQISLF